VKIIVVRHGQAEGNRENLIMGRSDSPLTDVGIKQAQDLIERLSPYNIQEILSSPQLRAIETIEPFAGSAKLKIQIDDRLMEIGCGSLEGKTVRDVNNILSYPFEDLLDQYNYDLYPYGGESSEEIRKRVQSLLDEVTKGQGKTTVLVTHGGIVRWLVYILTGEKIVGMENAYVGEFNV
jgi:broad specificity phosphatase PhoE